jgi:hypothetical protein
VSCEQRGHGMSGTKKVTVDQRAWRDAQLAAQRLREVNRELPAMLDALRRQQQAEAERSAAEMLTRQEQLENSLTGLSEQARRIEEQTSRRLRDSSARIWSQLQDTLQESREESRRALEAQEKRFQKQLAQEQAARDKDFRALKRELRGLGQHRLRAAAAARSMTADARLLHDTIETNLPHQRFAPGRLAVLRQRIEVAEGNLEQGLGEAALAQAQDAYRELGELRVEIELQDQEWQVAHRAAVTAVTVLQEQIRLNTVLDATDERGAPVQGATLDVDFWSEGELGALRAEVDTLAARLAAAEPQPDTEELRAIAGQLVPQLDEQLTKAVGLAHVRQLASQIRVNLAELVVNTLEQTAGYAWEEGQAIYAGGDQRRAFYSKLRAVDDSEIVVEVAPDETGESSVLRILSYDAVPDEEERVRRAHAIVDSLRAQGLAVGVPTAEREEPDPAFTDFERLSRPPEGPVQKQATRPVRMTEGAG